MSTFYQQQSHGKCKTSIIREYIEVIYNKKNFPQIFIEYSKKKILVIIEIR